MRPSRDLDGLTLRRLAQTEPAISRGLPWACRYDMREALAWACGDPVRKQKGVQMTTTQSTMFRDVAQRWLDENRPRWDPKLAANVASSFEKEVYPAIGKLPMAEITINMIMTLILEPLEERGSLEIAHRIHQRIWAVFRYAAALGLVPRARSSQSAPATGHGSGSNEEAPARDHGTRATARDDAQG